MDILYEPRIGPSDSRTHTTGRTGHLRQVRGSKTEEVARVEPRVPERTQVPLGMTMICDGEPPDSHVR